MARTRKKSKLVIEEMARQEGLSIKKTGEGKTFIEFNIYDDSEYPSKYPINRIAGTLKRKGCVIHRFGDPYSIMARCSKR